MATPLTFTLKGTRIREKKKSFSGIMVSIFISHKQDMFEIKLVYLKGNSRDLCGVSISVYKPGFRNYS